MTPLDAAHQHERLGCELANRLRAWRESRTEDDAPLWASIMMRSLEWEILTTLFPASADTTLDVEGLQVQATRNDNMSPGAVFLVSNHETHILYMSDLPDGIHEVYTQLRRDGVGLGEAREAALLLVGESPAA